MYVHYHMHIYAWIYVLNSCHCVHAFHFNAHDMCILHLQTVDVSNVMHHMQYDIMHYTMKDVCINCRDRITVNIRSHGIQANA